MIELGPILEEDGRVLQAIISATTPKVLVELGHCWGASARAMLAVMDSDAVLHSYDNTKDSSINDDPRFVFHRQSQEEVDVKNIDFVFLDASHELALNQETFINLLPNLNLKAIIAVHDTGIWIKGHGLNPGRGHELPDGRFVHCPDEIEFVNWINKIYPEFQQIHLHSNFALRHGITLLQQYTKL